MAPLIAVTWFQMGGEPRMAGSRLHEESPSVAKASPAGPVARPSFTWHGLHTWALVMAATAAAKILLPSPAEEMGVNWRVWEDASWDLGLPYLLSFAHLTASLVLAHRVEALLYGGAVMVRPHPLHPSPSGGMG